MMPAPIYNFAGATAEAIFWLAIAASAIQVRIMSATSQKKSAKRNAALGRNSGTTDYVVNVRLWPKADIVSYAARVRF
jgi:hypothetical protein